VFPVIASSPPGAEAAPALPPELASRLYFTAAGAIETSLVVLRARLGTYAVLLSLIAVPYLIAMAMMALVKLGVVAYSPVSTARVVVVLSMLAMAVSIAMFGPAATHATIEHLRGRDASAMASLRAAVRRVLPTVATGVAATVCVVIGLVALAVPGIIAMLALSLVMPIAVAERRGLVGALRRSAVLTRGHRTSLLAIGIGFIALCVAAWLCVAVVVILIAAAVHLLSGSPMDFTGPPGAALLSLAILVVLFAPLVLYPVMLGVTYHELAGGPVDRKQLADVFA
jgi:hypothetical protein